VYDAAVHLGHVGQPSPEPVSRTAAPVTISAMLATRFARARGRMRVRGFTRESYACPVPQWFAPSCRAERRRLHSASLRSRRRRANSVAHDVATFRTVAMTSAVDGSIASSRGGLVGIGVFSAPIRTTGWSSDQKHRSPISAAISAP